MRGKKMNQNKKLEMRSKNMIHSIMKINNKKKIVL